MRLHRMGCLGGTPPSAQVFHFSLQASQALHQQVALFFDGTGKSTLARLIMGCGGYTQASGQIRFAGTAINDLKIHQRARLGITLMARGLTPEQAIDMIVKGLLR